MKKTLYVVLLLLLLFGAFLIGTRYARQDTDHYLSAQPARQVLYYVDPMNPAHTSEKPGLAPCGMPMEPVYADNEGAGNGNSPFLKLPGIAKVTPVNSK